MAETARSLRNQLAPRYVVEPYQPFLRSESREYRTPEPCSHCTQLLRADTRSAIFAWLDLSNAIYLDVNKYIRINDIRLDSYDTLYLPTLFYFLFIYRV